MLYECSNARYQIVNTGHADGRYSTVQHTVQWHAPVPIVLNEESPPASERAPTLTASGSAGEQRASISIWLYIYILWVDISNIYIYNDIQLRMLLPPPSTQHTCDANHDGVGANVAAQRAQHGIEEERGVKLTLCDHPKEPSKQIEMYSVAHQIPLRRELATWGQAT